MGKASATTTFLLLPLASALLLAGCASSPRAPVSDVARADGSAKRPSPSAPAARSGRGGYYLDDGPGEAIPPNLENTPDAEPRIEAPIARANRPYVVFGRTYTPITDDQAFRQRGIGSWYGRRYHNQKTSSGEPYDMFAMTAAHPTLPIPSYARVTNVATGRQVIVRINDRGPFLNDRIIDLSYTAALKLGYLNNGSSELEVERLLPDEIARINERKAQNVLAASTPVSDTRSVPAPAVASVPVAPAAPEGSRVLGGLGGWYLQLGAFSQQANAEQVRSRSTGLAPGLEVVQANGMYRVYAGPWPSRAEAEAAAQSLKTAGSASAIIVQR